MNETKDDLKREKVRIVPISNIEDFPDHPSSPKDLYRRHDHKENEKEQR